MENKLLSTEELAKYLNISTKTLYMLRKEGLPFIKVSDKTYRYNLEDVLAWLEERRSYESSA